MELVGQIAMMAGFGAALWVLARAFGMGRTRPAARTAAVHELEGDGDFETDVVGELDD